MINKKLFEKPKDPNSDGPLPYAKIKRKPGEDEPPHFPVMMGGKRMKCRPGGAVGRVALKKIPDGEYGS